MLPARWRMAMDWERRARENPLHYIADYRETWEDEEEFFSTGRDDVEKVMTHCGWTGTGEKSLLEIGCGVGRMTRHLAERFASVTAIDISATMIREAQRLNSQLTNVTFSPANGVDLKAFDRDAFDYVMSYIVFQHLPSDRIIVGYITEALRVVKPAGSFWFHARNDFVHRRTDTYSGASITVEAVKDLAAKGGRRLVNLSGQGTGDCFFEIGPVLTR